MVVSAKRTFTCVNVCSYCERTIAEEKADAATVQTALNRLKKRKKKCKDHPDATVIRHVRRAELPAPTKPEHSTYRRPRAY